ncbi:MAG: hypothetical protein ACYS74_03950, partial [Planctomycetota bacterium]
EPPFRRICEECHHPMRREARCAVCDFVNWRVKGNRTTRTIPLALVHDRRGPLGRLIAVAS